MYSLLERHIARNYTCICVYVGRYVCMQVYTHLYVLYMHKRTSAEDFCTVYTLDNEEKQLVSCNMSV